MVGVVDQALTLSPSEDRKRLATATATDRPKAATSAAFSVAVVSR